SDSGFSHGIAVLASILRNSGYKVGIVDASSENLTTDGTVNKIGDLNPKIIGITGLIQASAFNKEVSIKLKAKMPDIIQIAGGSWAEYVPEYILRNTKVDYVAVGEADLIISELVKMLLGKESVNGISGVSFIDKDGNYIETGPMVFPRNLDELPLPAFDLFKMDYYTLITKPENYPFPLSKYFIRRIKKNTVDGNLRLVSISSGRGCYGRCDYCAAAHLMRRNFSPSYVADHMKFLMDNYGANAFNFTESLTLSTRNWVKAFCNEIIDRKLNVFYIALARADFNYDDETINLLRESGCIDLGFGFESGDNLMLTSFHKKTTVERYHQVISDFKNTGIAIGGSFVLNMPGENYDTIKNTIDFIRKTRVGFGYGFAYPYPGSDLFRFAKANSFCDLDDVMFKESNKRLTSINAFNDYIGKYNFNNLDIGKLWKVNKTLDKLVNQNYFYSKNKFLFLLVIIFPFYNKFKQVYFLIKNLLFRILRKLKRCLKKILKIS
ncbi:MAG: B12-binding domain-containing radical SAM protein, partial [Candidatus Humimicrobiaceae bacterium]